MKKKLIAAVASVCLVAVVGVGATLAYYTSETEARVNTFTVGDVDIEVVEPEWDPEKGEDLVPGAEVSKNPMITNTGASAGYMMLEVTGMDEMAEKGFITMVDGVEGYNAADWVLVDKNTGNPIQTDKLVDGFYVYVGTEGAVAAGESTSALFTAVKLTENAAELTATQHKVIANFKDAEGNLFTFKDVNGNVIEANKDKTPAVDAAGNPIIVYTINGVADQTFNTYADAEQYVLDNFKEEASFVFNLSVKGYAIQSDNVEFVTNGAYTWVADLTK